MEASVLPKITDDLPTIPASLVTQWKHLSELGLAYPIYGIPAGVDILLEGKVLSKAVLHDWKFSPTGAHSAFKMCFGWVLNGEANGESQQRSTHFCGVALNKDSKGVYKRRKKKSKKP